MNNAQTQLAAQVANAMTPGTEEAGAFIDVLIQLLPVILEAFQNCNQTPEQIHKRADRASIWDRVALRMMVRRSMGVQAYRQVGGRRIEDALFAVASDGQNVDLIAAAMRE